MLDEDKKEIERLMAGLDDAPTPAATPSVSGGDGTHRVVDTEELEGWCVEIRHPAYICPGEPSEHWCTIPDRFESFEEADRWVRESATKQRAHFQVENIDAPEWRVRIAFVTARKEIGEEFTV